MEDIKIDRYSLMLLFLVSVVIHFLIFVFSKYAIAPDSQAYIEIARSFREGDIGDIPARRPFFYPFVVAILSFAVKDFELSGCLVSMLFASLLSIIVLYLCLNLYGKEVALTGYLLTLFQPSLMIYSFHVLTEITYVSIVILGLACGWVAIMKERKKLFLLSGLLFGLAYLTRNEGLVYGLLYFVFYLLYSLFRGNYRRKNILINTGAYLLPLGMIVLSYAIFLHWKLDEWVLTAKMNNLAVGLVSGKEYNEISPGSALLFVASHYKAFLIKYFRNLKDALTMGLSDVISPLLLIFVGIGLFTKPWMEREKLGNIYLLCFFMLPFLVTSLSHVNSRYYLSAVPITLIFISKGVINFQGWLSYMVGGVTEKNWIGRTMRYRYFTLVVLLCFMIPLAASPALRIPLHLLPIYEIEYKEAGLWLKNNTPENAIVMGQKGQIRFYAQRRGVSTRCPGDKKRSKSFEEILKLAKEGDSEYYLVVDERWSKRAKRINFLLNEKDIPKNLGLVYVNNKYSGAKVVVYRILH